MKEHAVARLRRALRRSGFDLTRHPHRMTLEGDLERVMRVQAWSLAIDVGGNQGQFGRKLRALGYHGTIVSFEPSFAAYQVLSRVVESDDRWHCHQLALGREAGTATLRTFVGSDLNSLHEPMDGVSARFKTAVATGTETVRVATLADMSRSFRELAAPGGPWLLKCDTQGHDLEVLEGGLSELPEVTALLVELSVQPLYADQPSMETVLPKLADWGFQPTGFFPVSRQSDGLSVVEFDGVFVKTSGPAT